MSALKDGGPAFPGEGLVPGVFGGPEKHHHCGMTLRDWFAGQLVAGLALNCGDGCAGYMEQRARVAYQFADAMLAERAKTK